MSGKTKIEWTDETWNPVTGCVKVSPGCKNCYAEREWPRMTKLVPAYAGREFTDVRCHPDRLDKPLRWQKPRMIFVNSMSDLFHDDVSDEFIDEVFAVMALAKQHVFQILTKRPERLLKHPIFTHSGSCLWVGVRQAAERLFGIDPGPMDKALPNVWLGVSVENQEAADTRIPILLKTPAAVRWISAEPLLGPVDLTDVRNSAGLAEGQRSINALGGYAWECSGPDYVDTCNLGSKIDWVVVGGESGSKARPMHPLWAKSLRDQCEKEKVPFLFKQWGEWAPVDAIGDDDNRVLKEVWIRIDGSIIDDGDMDFIDGDTVLYRAGAYSY